MPRINTRDSTTRTSFESRSQKAGTDSPGSGPERPPHKRTLSGNPRVNSMLSNEERRTEKHTVTTRETLTSRTRSPDRRHGPSMSTGKARAEPRRAADTASKDLRQEAPPQGTMETPEHARLEMMLTCK